MSKVRRHRVISRLLKSGPVQGQEALRRMLAEEGVEATQATISRDIRELGVLKSPEGYVLPDAMDARHPSTDRVLEMSISSFLVSAEAAGTLVVLKTEPGHAQALAASLDRSALRKVVGTIAGDDTIFLATRSERDAASVLKSIKDLDTTAEQSVGVGIGHRGNR
ncbi:MAG: ArgR family transcriptional regulator [Planctomycetes bacterium]|nr:ArgR family transcriptional regulator [Planctomycetota bacterium]